jgi:hypothetical protein
MEPHELIRKIDDRFLYKISEGCSLEELIEHFTGISESCQKRSTFIKVRLKYLVTNWKLIDPNRFSNLEGEKLYKLLRLKDILDNK